MSTSDASSVGDAVRGVRARKPNPIGVTPRHSRACRSATGGACSCSPTYAAWVFDRGSGRKIKRTFTTLAAAKAWRQDSQVALRRGELRAAQPVTVRQAADAWLTGARAGEVRNRSGDPYKPSVIRGYQHSLEARILPALGGAKLHEIRRADVQALVDRLLGEGLDASTIRNSLMPLRVIYRRAIARGVVAVNPTTGLELPAVRGRRERIAGPEEAARLLDALAERDRALWGTAFYAGLRRGELRALRWEDVDLAAGRIRVERSWDDEAGPVEPKSRAGRRTVPILAGLRDLLIEHKLRAGGAGFVFGPVPGRPFTPSAVRRRAETAWARAELEPIGLHEARHSFASLLIAAGVNAKAITSFMGHSSITITFDLYGHLMPGSEAEAAALADAYLERATTQARLAQVR